MSICECGCGGKTRVPRKSHLSRGIVRGVPNRFITGHNAKMKAITSGAERLARRLPKSDPDDCWEWPGSKDTFGYGLIRHNGRLTATHRLAFEQANGSIPDGQCVLHRCDNPPCCNPAHLFLGTQKINSDDMILKGRARHPNGERIPNHRLVADAVIELRFLASAGMKQRDIAKRFGISQRLVWNVIHRRAWRHIP